MSLLFGRFLTENWSTVTQHSGSSLDAISDQNSLLCWVAFSFVIFFFQNLIFPAHLLEIIYFLLLWRLLRWSQCTWCRLYFFRLNFYRLNRHFWHSQSIVSSWPIAAPLYVVIRSVNFAFFQHNPSCSHECPLLVAGHVCALEAGSVQMSLWTSILCAWKRYHCLFFFSFCFFFFGVPIEQPGWRFWTDTLGGHSRVCPVWIAKEGASDNTRKRKRAETGF